MHSEDLVTSNTTTDVAQGDPRLGRFYINAIPDAATSLITQGGLTRPARRDKCAFTTQGSVAKRLLPDANRWKRSSITSDDAGSEPARISFFVLFLLKSSTTP